MGREGARIRSCVQACICRVVVSAITGIHTSEMILMENDILCRREMQIRSLLKILLRFCLYTGSHGHVLLEQLPLDTRIHMRKVVKHEQGIDIGWLRDDEGGKLGGSVEESDRISVGDWEGELAHEMGHAEAVETGDVASFCTSFEYGFSALRVIEGFVVSP